MKEYQVDQKIKYKLFDKKSKEHWFNGVIHGVKRFENEAGVITKITYLVDTGRHERLDEHPFNHREREMSKRIRKLVRSGEAQSHPEALQKVLEYTDLPDDKPDVEVFRQPEQIELTEEFIAPRK